MKLSPAQREALALLKLADEPQTARALRVNTRTLHILLSWGCVDTVTRPDGVYWRITERGRQEAAG